MEFCHFLPTPCYPEAMKSKSVFMGPLNDLLNKGRARLYNGQGERFMEKYYPGTGEREKGGEQNTRAIGLLRYVREGEVPTEAFTLIYLMFQRGCRNLSFPKLWERCQLGAQE